MGSGSLKQALRFLAVVGFVVLIFWAALLPPQHAMADEVDEAASLYVDFTYPAYGQTEVATGEYYFRFSNNVAGDTIFSSNIGYFGLSSADGGSIPINVYRKYSGVTGGSDERHYIYIAPAVELQPGTVYYLSAWRGVSSQAGHRLKDTVTIQFTTAGSPPGETDPGDTADPDSGTGSGTGPGTGPGSGQGPGSGSGNDPGTGSGSEAVSGAGIESTAETAESEPNQMVVSSGAETTMPSQLRYYRLLGANLTLSTSDGSGSGSGSGGSAGQIPEPPIEVLLALVFFLLAALILASVFRYFSFHRQTSSLRPK